MEGFIPIFSLILINPEFIEEQSKEKSQLQRKKEFLEENDPSIGNIRGNRHLVS